MPMQKRTRGQRPTDHIIVEKPVSVEKSVCGTASLTLSEQQQHQHHPMDQRNADDTESLDFLDEMINESSARWKESIQTMNTTTMMNNSWTSLSSQSNPVGGSPTNEELRASLPNNRSPRIVPMRRTTSAPVSHVHVPTGFFPPPDDEITIDWNHNEPRR